MAAAQTSGPTPFSSTTRRLSARHGDTASAVLPQWLLRRPRAPRPFLPQPCACRRATVTPPQRCYPDVCCADIGPHGLFFHHPAPVGAPRRHRLGGVTPMAAAQTSGPTPLSATTLRLSARPLDSRGLWLWCGHRGCGACHAQDLAKCTIRGRLRVYEPRVLRGAEIVGAVMSLQRLHPAFVKQTLGPVPVFSHNPAPVGAPPWLKRAGSPLGGRHGHAR